MFKKILDFFIRNSKRIFRGREKRRIIIIALVILAIIVARGFFLNKDSQVEDIENAPRQVEVARVIDIINNRLPLPVLGRVESSSEAVLRAERQGEISAVYKKIGDSVKAGEIIAQIKNASERAEVLRAEGVLQSARASLLKVQGNSGNSKTLIINSVRSAFTTADDAIHNKVDQFITDADTRVPKVIVASESGLTRQAVEDGRIQIGEILNSWEISISNISSLSTDSELNAVFLEAQQNLESIRSFLDIVATDVNTFQVGPNISESQVNKYKSDISIARSNIDSTLSSLVTSYNSFRSSVELGGKGEDILSAEATVTQAEAGLLSAQASLEKTIVRSPISGAVNQIDVKQGDFVGSFEQVAVVANNNALEIKAFINEADLASIAIGANVDIEGKWQGVVTRISPAINQQTKKIELSIGVDESTDLINGQSVSLKIERNNVVVNEDSVITIPLSALKVQSDGTYVYTLDNENKTVANKVETGSIVGNKIIITEGLTKTMNIILDARGLKVGQEVTPN